MVKESGISTSLAVSSKFILWSMSVQPVRDEESHFLLCYRKEPHRTRWAHILKNKLPYLFVDKSHSVKMVQKMRGVFIEAYHMHDHQKAKKSPSVVLY